MIAFVAAEAREYCGLLPHLQNARKPALAVQWAVSGELNGKGVVLVANGPGPVLAGWAADAVRENQKVEALVSYGFCGALDPALGVNDIFVSAWGNSQTSPSLPKGRSVTPRSGELVSVDRVLCTSAEKSELRKMGADAVDMETAGLAERARAWNIPFYCIRIITDAAHEGFAIDFNKVRDSDGRFSRSKIIAAAMRNPLKLIPELMKLDSRTKSAAKILGDFVATCEF